MFLTGLGGSLCRLVVLLVLCRQMVSVPCYEKSLLILAPALGMLRPLGHAVFMAWQHLLPSLGIVPCITFSKELLGGQMRYLPHLI